MNWEYRLVPSSAGELDSSNFRGIKLYKKLLDDSGLVVAEVEVSAEEFRDSASQAVKDTYSQVCKDVFSQHIENAFTLNNDGELPYQLDHSFGAMLYAARSNYRTIFGLE